MGVCQDIWCEWSGCVRSSVVSGVGVGVCQGIFCEWGGVGGCQIICCE